ncbi:hypothetical protein E2C01_052486 [Portunus trituberculatus]|uniref:Uncharacterized protein n=1 Tax=Portunus trituberculatus TaxID=210409 RepID=A0A5B7GEN5_PORTR|nr:hypothetical protein [Portunus trituberculatus]
MRAKGMRVVVGGDSESVCCACVLSVLFVVVVVVAARVVKAPCCDGCMIMWPIRVRCGGRSDGGSSGGGGDGGHCVMEVVTAAR